VNAVACRHLAVTYDGHPVVSEVSFTVASGEWLVVLGPNGAGKSSLLSAIAGVVPAEGEILLGGAAAGSRRQRALQVALVPQSPVIPEGMTVSEYVALGRTPHLGTFGHETSHDLEVVADSIARLGLVGLERRPVATLSGGERQRAVLARAIAQEARVLLLDEPTSALDIGHQQQVMELIDGLRHDGYTVLAALHDLNLAAQYADRVLLLSRGEVVEDGAARDIIRPDVIREVYGAEVRVTVEGGLMFVTASRR
jgi:iron complex transport system ATP-binding protein